MVRSSTPSGSPASSSKRQDVVGPLAHVRQAHAQLQSLVEDLHHRQGVRLTAIDARDRDGAAAPHGVRCRCRRAGPRVGPPPPFSVTFAATAPGSKDLLAWRQGRDIRSEDVNSYIQEKIGEDFSAKDFRTWHGTVLAAVELAGEPKPASEAGAKRAISVAVGRVAEALGNTPAVCRRSYIDPRVIERFREGETISPTSSINGRMTARARRSSSAKCADSSPEPAHSLWPRRPSGSGAHFGSTSEVSLKVRRVSPLSG